MITKKELVALLEDIGVPVGYRISKKDKKPPYISYYLENSNNVEADGVIYFTIESLAIEFYMASKDPEFEEKIEQCFNDNDLIWNKEEDYTEGTNRIIVTYRLDVKGETDGGE